MEEIITELGLKIDAMKTETVTKAELLQVMSEVTALKSQNDKHEEFKAEVTEIALKSLNWRLKGLLTKTYLKALVNF